MLGTAKLHRALYLERRESEERYLSLSEASFEGLLVHVRGRVIDVNTRLQEMFGHRLEELTGMRPTLSFTKEPYSIFCMMCCRCTSTVLELSFNLYAIRLVESPENK